MTCHDCGGAIPAGEQWEKGGWWPGVFACDFCAETWGRLQSRMIEYFRAGGRIKPDGTLEEN